MNTIQIVTVCISIAALALNLVNCARWRKRYKETVAKLEEMKKRIDNLNEWDNN